jgi:hypothetical protein
MPEPKTKCTNCSYEMLATTAERTGGLCVPCSEGRTVDRTPRNHERKPGRSIDWQSIGILLDNDKSAYADYFFEADVWDKDPRYKARSMRVGTNRGLMRLHKDSGVIELLQPMPEDDDEKRFRSASSKLAKHWKAGEIPKATQFACG